jgi:RNA polymerase sigma factor (TIGR02999 family)
MIEAAQLRGVAGRGGPLPADELLPAIYSELRRLAASKMASQPAGQTIQATALVHEAYLKLTAGRPPGYKDSRHFFAAAAEAMRQILIDRARKRLAAKHGGGKRPVPLDSLELPADAPGDEDRLLAVDEVLDLLEAHDPVKAQVIKLRFFAGLENAEIAEILGVSAKTVQRYWITARAWLFRRLDHSSASPGHDPG